MNETKPNKVTAIEGHKVLFCPGAKGKSPSFNHAWYIWDCKNEGAPRLAYVP